MTDHHPSQSSPHDNEESADDEIHRGYDLESGMLTRVREWTDLLPWLRLVRTLRVAGSPPLLMLVALALAVWVFGSVAWFGHSLPNQSPSSGASTHSAATLFSLPGGLATSLVKHVQLLIPTRFFALQEQTSDWTGSALAILWSMLVWIPVTLVLIRQGALLTAKRPMMGFVESIKFALKRTGYAWIAAMVPLGCVAFVALDVFLLGWIGSWGRLAAIPLSLIAALVSLIGGLLMFGAYIAVPMAWSALVNEKDADPLDSLSRGYEYLFRRPLDLLLSSGMALVVLSAVAAIALGITIAAQQIAGELLALSGTNERMIQDTQSMLSYFPLVVLIAGFWSLVGGVYLLMRSAAGGQEIEDLWVPLSTVPSALPSLPQNAHSQ
jgi:hypothetical protein